MTLSFLTPAQHRRLIAKAWRDERFKEELIQNPKAVIEREFGIKLPDDLEIQVVEEGEEGEGEAGKPEGQNTGTPES